MTDKQIWASLCKFDIGDKVQLLTDAEKRLAFITGLNVRPGCVSYHVTRDTTETIHYDFELITWTGVSV